jgi:hypothetical protein
MDNKKIIIVIFSLFLYFWLNWIPYGNLILYPVQIFVTFLHEIGHAFFALVTWWSVHGIKMLTSWWWYALTSGWIEAIVIAWWYLWSAIFGNILMYVAMKKNEIYSQNILKWLWILSIFVGFVWFQSILSTILLFFTWWILLWVAYKTHISQIFLLVLWVLSVAYIIQDFWVGPGSDLQKFADIFIIIPKIVWMYVWLAIAIMITYLTWKKILKN